MKLSMPRFDQAPVLVVGDVMLDRYWHGATSRISPEAPVPVVRVEQHEDRPGGAANVALNIAALGAQALLVGVTGRDEAADSLANSLKAAGVDARFQRIDSQPTIVKLRVMSRHQQLLRVDFEEPFRTDAAALAVDVESLLAKVKVLVLSDYGKGALQNHQVLIQAARARNIPVLADPKGKDFAIYRGASLITPNLSEFETIVGRCADEAELVAKGQELMSELDLGALLVTRGEHGMTLLRHGQPALHLPARAREVFDVTGAGDTVISTLAAALAAGEELPSAVGLANLAAGIVVGKLGTAAISAPLRSLVTMAITPWPPRPRRGNLLSGVRLPKPRSEAVRICAPDSGISMEISCCPLPRRMPRTPRALRPMMRTTLSAKRITLPALENSMTSLAPSVIAAAIRVSPSSSLSAIRPLLRGRLNCTSGVFFTVPKAVAMKM